MPKTCHGAQLRLRLDGDFRPVSHNRTGLQSFHGQRNSLANIDPAGIRPVEALADGIGAGAKNLIESF